MTHSLCYFSFITKFILDICGRVAYTTVNPIKGIIFEMHALFFDHDKRR